MRRYQKVILGILVVLVVGIIGVTIYGMQVYRETNATFNQILTLLIGKQTNERKRSALKIEIRFPFC